MELLKKVEMTVFDVATIGRGDLIYVTSPDWNTPKKGIVTVANEKAICFEYFPEISNVTRMKKLLVDDVKAGKYTIRWTADMAAVNVFDPSHEAEAQEEAE